MTDRDGITGTFFWTPGGSVPPLTITVSSTVSNVVASTVDEVVTSTKRAETATPKTTKVQAGESTQSSLTQEASKPQSIEPSHPTPTSVSNVSQTQTQAQTQAQTRTQTKAPTQAQIQTQTQPQTKSTLASPDSGLLSVTSSPLVTILGNTGSSSWEISTVGTSQSSGAISNTTGITPPAVSVIATSQPKPTPTAAPHAGLTKGVIVGISSGGVVLVAAFIGLIFYIRSRSKKARSRNSEVDIKKKIGNPVQPTPAKRLSQDSLDRTIFPTRRFSQDSRAVLLARSASAASSLKSNSLNRSPSQRPESYTSVFSELSTTPTSQFSVPAQARASVMEIAPLSSSSTLHVPPTTQVARVASSYYGSESHRRDTMDTFVGVAGRPDFGNLNPFLPNQTTQDRPETQIENKYHNTYQGVGNSYEGSGSTHLRPIRNLMERPNRRSSLISNQRFDMENRTIAESEVSNNDSEWQFDVQAGTESQRINAPTLREQSSYNTREAHQSTYPISILNGYRSLADIDENIEEVVGNAGLRMGAQGQFEIEGNSQRVGEVWEEQRRRIFEERRE